LPVYPNITREFIPDAANPLWVSDPKENAQAGRVNSTMKNELLKGMIFHDIREMRAAIRIAVDFCNHPTGFSL
jgi:hypothetical protein